MSKKKPQISIDDDVHYDLKQYCAFKRKKISHIASKVLRDFLHTKHEEIASEGDMVIEEQGERPEIKTIVGVLEEREPRRSPRRSLQDIQIVNKGNRYIVVKK